MKNANTNNTGNDNTNSNVVIEGMTAHVTFGIGGDGVPAHKGLTAELDFSGASTEDLIRWACRDRVIALQLALRATAKAHGGEAMESVCVGKVIKRRATDAGARFFERTAIDAQFASLDLIAQITQTIKQMRTLKMADALVRQAAKTSLEAAGLDAATVEDALNTLGL